jgi:hypothetical protein
MADYEPSKAGWQEIAMSPQIQAACLAEARRGMAFAVGISPRSEDGDGKPYADSFEVEPMVTHQFRGGPRVGARLRNRAGHAAAVEFGNTRMRRPHRVLARVAAFLGAG